MSNQFIGAHPGIIDRRLGAGSLRFTRERDPVITQAVAETLDRDVDELSQLLGRAAELLEPVKDSRLPALDFLQSGRSGVHDLLSLTVEIGEAAAALG